MPDSLRADEFVGQFSNITRPAAQYYHLKASIVIEVGMECRDDDFVMFMLKISEFFGEQSSVVVIDQRHGSYDRGP